MARLDKNVIELIGDKALIKRLKYLSNNASGRVMKQSISKGLNPVKRQAKKNLGENRRSGALRKAISKQTGKTITNRAWGRVYVKSRPQEYNGKMINPSRYAHFLEFGTRHSKPYPFLRVAMSQSRAQIMMEMRKETKIRLDRLANRARRRFRPRKKIKKRR